MSKSKAMLSEFIFENIEDVKLAFIKNKLCIESGVLMTQDSDGTISSWPTELATKLWFEQGMWFASTGKESELASTVFKHDIVFDDHSTAFTCVHIGVGCVEYDDDVTCSTINRNTTTTKHQLTALYGQRMGL